MKKRVIVMVVSAVIMALLVSVVSARVTLQNESIVRTYTGGETIRGSATLSLSNEPATEVVASTFPGSIRLLDLLQANNFVQNKEYTCTTKACRPTYAAREGISSVSLATSGKQTIGFEIKDNDVSIRSLDFSISSNIGQSCSIPLSMRLFEQNESIVPALRAADGQTCGAAKSGCFSSTLDASAYKSATLSSELYCNKVTLEPAPAYLAGAVVSASSAQPKILLELFDEKAGYLNGCSVTGLHAGTQTIGCVINASISRKGDYYVCITTDSGANSPYTVRFEKEEPICGGAALGITSSRDYELSVQPIAYAPLATVSIAAVSTSAGNSLADQADMYIAEMYERDCSKGCVLPFMFEGSAQTLSLTNVSLSYSTEGNVVGDTVVHRLETSVPLISSNRSLNVDFALAHFLIPLSTPERTFQITLGENSLFPAPLGLSISPGFVFQIAPQTALLGVENVFHVVSESTIVRSTWKFDGGSEQGIVGNKNIHSFETLGNHTLTVKATNEAGVNASQTITIFVGNVNESVLRLLEEYENRVGNISAGLQTFPTTVQEQLRSRLDLTNVSAFLAATRKTYSPTQNESISVALVHALLELKLPVQIAIPTSGSVPLGIGFESLDPSYVVQLANTSISTEAEEELRQNIFDWNSRQNQAIINFSVISGVTQDGKQEVLLGMYTLEPRLASTAAQPIYLIIDYPREQLSFVGNDNVQSITSGTHSGTVVSLSGNTPITFTSTSFIEPAKFGAFLSPQLSALGNYHRASPLPPPQFPRFWFWSGIGSIILGTLIVYIILQEWYRKKYQRYLFKTDDELYNLVYFIYNSRATEMSDHEIAKKLSGIGWHREQISYAFKKIDGKRTGMFEIPLFRHRDDEKTREELEKRSPKPVDVRFIKRPSYTV